MTARSTAFAAVLATLLAFSAGVASAQAPEPAAGAKTAAAAPAPAPQPSADLPPADEHAPPLVETAAPATKDPKIQHLVTEDSQVRIEETRVRGVTTHIVVHSKIPGMGSYEIQPRDPSVSPDADKTAGMRLFSFGFGH